ncbi:MAG: copper-binding protein [Sphingomonadales bacterium]|nr:copper-binding protein [Sphingomonadales bacterium]MDE2171939.1 copper-binding protein [Sphingomonadales bacterium]
MTYVRLTLMLGLAALTAACNKKVETPTAAPTSRAMSANGSMATEASAANTIDARGHGTVTAIDKTGGMITLKHEAIPEANWPAMTMAFKAAPAVTHAVVVGDKVTFDLKIKGSSGEVTSIHKQ